MRSPKPILVWFRRDLRLADNPALAHAAASDRPVIPVFVRDPDAAGAWCPGGAARWWLHGSLLALSDRLAALGSPLVLRSGPAATVLVKLAQETDATTVLWNRRCEP